MRIPIKWLRDYLEYESGAAAVTDPDEIARRMTMAGIEVTSVDKIGQSWDNIYVAKILALNPHPNADRLQLVDVDFGRPEPKTVVTGARNLAVGDIVPFATVGARLIDGHSAERRETVLKPAKLRGVVSDGMVCSELELGLSGEHEGIMHLDPECKVGALLADELGDAVLDADVTPNQVHCLSMIGAAWEVAALTGGKVKPPEIGYAESGKSAEASVTIQIDEPELCPRYTAAIVRNVKIGPSPRWLRERLRAAGVRPINNVVDVTNFVMFEMNQPLHAFDYDRLDPSAVEAGEKPTIVIRRARSGEEITTLDGQERKLDTNMLVIADSRKPIAVAGVMGGLETEVTAETTTVLLESANFNPRSIRRTARDLKLPSEAARRFERGIPREYTEMAVRRAAMLLALTASGEVAPGLVDAYPLPAEERHLTLKNADVERLLGATYSTDEIARVLISLGHRVERADEDTLTVTPPPFRIDVFHVADLIEDVIRITGYETLPDTMPDGPLPEPTVDPVWELEARLRGLMVGLGFEETIAYTAASRKNLARIPRESGEADDLARALSERLLPDVEPVAIENPLSTDFEVLRTSAIGSLLGYLSQNLRRTDSTVSLFEIGKLFLGRDDDLPEERPVLTAAMGAYHRGRSWGSREENDFFDVKGAAEALLDRLGVSGVEFRPLAHPLFHPTRAAAFLLPEVGKLGLGERLLGAVGELSEAARAVYDIENRAFLFGLDLSRLPETADQRRYLALPRYPAIEQDVALVLSSEVPAEAIDSLIREAGGEIVDSVELFDVYVGDPIPEGSRSLAYHIAYRATDRTLTDADVASVHRRIEEALQERLGAKIRA